MDVDQTVSDLLNRSRQAHSRFKLGLTDQRRSRTITGRSFTGPAEPQIPAGGKPVRRGVDAPLFFFYIVGNPGVLKSARAEWPFSTPVEAR